MADMGMGAGLAAMAFWGFIAVVVVGGMWYSIREKEARHETLRRLYESGQAVDASTIDKVLALSEARSVEDLRTSCQLTAYILFALVPGMLVLGYFLSYINTEAFWPIVGVSGLLAFLGAGFALATRALRQAD